MTSSTRLGRALAAAAVALAALVLAPLPASAHTALVGSSPEEGETVTSLDEVSLEFTEQLLEIGNELALEAPDGTVTALEIEEPITETITAAVPASALGDGVHVLRFRVVSADGHPIEGEVTFTVEAPAGSLATIAARNDFFQDSFNRGVFERPGTHLTRTLVYADAALVDGAVTKQAEGWARTGEVARRTQTGQVRSYALTMLVGLVIVIVVVVLGGL